MLSVKREKSARVPGEYEKDQEHADVSADTIDYIDQFSIRQEERYYGAESCKEQRDRGKSWSFLPGKAVAGCPEQRHTGCITAKHCNQSEAGGKGG